MVIQWTLNKQSSPRIKITGRLCIYLKEKYETLEF